ncbi:helix-turn-helix domain-containing protein [Nocardia sp. 2]|uniref:Helix-turn-helix domain-containing protein n=1 Tax=Nocardia acididurans TaxID=2802282 RepID=A0ABS1MHV6_9NOCA|nr:helix-turn-helix transcriptional regulator [Nocardia acididurans]MBL1079864.1 helix-turn-helix domain-containing protein [Nocardia acididurans]
MVGSTLPQRAFGRVLREHRIRSGKSQLTAGMHIDLSPQSIGRLEDGQRVRLSTVQLAALLDCYGLADPSAARAEVFGLWEEVRQELRTARLHQTGYGWWRVYADQYATHFDHYMSLESSAVRLTTFQLALVPGIVQHDEYRRAMILAAEPDIPPGDITRRLELAARRQRLLADRTDNCEVRVLLSEAALRHRPCDRAAMAAQLRYLAESAVHRNISVRVVPWDTDRQPGTVTQSFTLLEFPRLPSRDLIEPPVVYIETPEGALFLEQDAAIARHRKAVNDIEHVALSESDTQDLVLRIAEEYST